MRSTGDTTSGDETQDVNHSDDFLGRPDATDRTIDTAQRIKTLSVGYCAMNPERAKIANKRILIGRMGGTAFGVERQLRNPETATKSPELAEYGQALAGNFNADVYSDDGEIIAEYTDAGFLYFPTGHQEAALARLQKMSDQERERGMVFSAFIYAEPAQNPRGYRYMLMNAMRVEEGIRDARRALQQEAALIAARVGGLNLLPDGRPERGRTG